MNLKIQELNARKERFITLMNANHLDWDTVLIVSKVNQYYFTGTMQEGLLVICRNGVLNYFVRKSYARAILESPLPESSVRPMNSYRDVAEVIGGELGNTYIEGDTITHTMVERLQKSFNIAKLGNAENTLKCLRSIKSPYELHWIIQSGKQHNELLINDVPALLKEGISEAELFGEIFTCMTKRSYHGISRFSMFQHEIIVGQLGFSENSLCPASFNGPSGTKGYSAAAPLGGDPDRKLKKGDLVFVDVGFGINGYHTDKTQVYIFGAKPSEEAAKIQQACIDVQKRVAEQIKPGAIPSNLYQDCLDSLPEVLQQGFMGYGNSFVKFLGHGVGLYVDDFPVIAKGFDEPLEENMVIALEPKKGLSGVGMLGVEETYVVSAGGGMCVTGGGREIIVV